jgi:SnoaL-like protein
MNTSQIANRLVELCRAGKFTQAQEELYSEDAASIEPPGTPPGPLGSVKGRAALREKSKAFDATYETIHGVSVSDPLVAGNFFSIKFGLDVTWKERGRSSMEEIGVYEVRDGKIVQEQWFYSLPSG